MSYPGTTSDTVTISRPALTTDAEGDPTGAEAVVFTGAGTWGTASVKDQEVGAQRGTVVDAICILDSGVDVRVGDTLNTRAQNWQVEGVQDVRIHARVQLRRLGN